MLALFCCYDLPSIIIRLAAMTFSCVGSLIKILNTIYAHHLTGKILNIGVFVTFNINMLVSSKSVSTLPQKRKPFSLNNWFLWREILNLSQVVAVFDILSSNNKVVQNFSQII